MEDGAYVSFAEMKPWMELEEINYHDGDLGKELYEVYSNFENKVRTFKEAKMAMYNKGKSRGYFKPKGKGKFKSKKGSGFGKPSAMAVSPSGKGYGGKSGKGSSSSSTGRPSDKPGYTGCFICGDLGHDYRMCPKRSQPTSPSARGANLVAWVDENEGEEYLDQVDYPSDICESDVCPFEMQDRKDELWLFQQEAAGMEQVQAEIMMTQSDESDDGAAQGEGEDLAPHVLAAQQSVPETSDKLRYAVVDTGATETVGSLDALQFIMNKRLQDRGHEMIEIDTSRRKSFRFGNGESKRSVSHVRLPQTVNGEFTALGVYAMDVPEVPILLGIKTLRRLGAIIDITHETIEFRRLFPGVRVHLCQGRNGHLLLDMCSDWVTLESYSPMNRPIQENLMTVESESKEEPNAIPAAHSASVRNVTWETTKERHDVLDKSVASMETKDTLRTTKDNGTKDNTEIVTETENVHVSVASVRPAQEDSKILPDSHGDRESHVAGPQQDGGPGEEGNQEEGVAGVVGQQVGLGSRSTSRSKRSSSQWTALSGEALPGASGEGLPVGSQRLRKVDNMCSVSSSAVLCAGSGPERHSSQPGPDSNGRGDSNEDKGRRSTTKRSDHSEHWSAGSGGFVVAPLGGGEGAESQVERQEEAGESPGSQFDSGVPEHGGHGQEGSQERSSFLSGGTRGRAEAGERRHMVSSDSTVHTISCGLNECTDPSSNNLRSDFEEELRNETYVTWETPKDVLGLLAQQTEKCVCEVVEAFSAFSGFQLDFMEVCCGPDSGLTTAVREMGGTAERIGLQNNMDLTTPNGLERARKFCAETRPRSMWLSPICGPTSPMQNVSQRTLKQCLDLKRKRKMSRKMAKSCVILAREQLERNGEIGWEWPFRNDGWFSPKSKSFSRNWIGKVFCIRHDLTVAW